MWARAGSWLSGAALKGNRRTCGAPLPAHPTHPTHLCAMKSAVMMRLMAPRSPAQPVNATSAQVRPAGRGSGQRMWCVCWQAG